MTAPRGRRALPPRAGRVLLLLAVAAVLPLPAAAASGSANRLEAPVATDVVRAYAIADSVLARSAVRAVRPAAWGGRFQTASGQEVTLEISDRYPIDQAVAERWAAYFGSLVHGEELSTLVAYIAPIREVQSICGPEALACYSPRDGMMVTPGEDVAGHATAEALMAHEYGHHVAANRLNPPWRAVDYGTKRWASHEDICSDARTGRVYPGNEADPRRYALNPGEGFAEAYRVLNERKLAVAESSWDIVSRIFYPDDTALSLLERDVLTPWTKPTTATSTRRVSPRGKARSHSVATALDGTLRIRLRAPSTARVRVELRSATDGRISQATVRGGERTLTTTVCGARTHSVRVTTLAGRGSYRLTVEKP